MYIKNRVIYHEPKKGGMVDALRSGMFLEYLADMWQEDEIQLDRDEMIENETNQILEEKYEETN